MYDPRTSGLTIGILAGTFVLAACTDLAEELPEQVEIGNVIATRSAGFFMESCNNAIYALSVETAEKVQNEGAEFLERRESGSKHHYSNWRETPAPVPEGGSVYSSYPILPCGEQDDFPHQKIEEALTRSGSFYALTPNGEGMLLVAPRQRIAAVFYVG